MINLDVKNNENNSLRAGSHALCRSKVDVESRERCASKQNELVGDLAREMRACTEGIVFQIRSILFQTEHSDW